MAKKDEKKPEYRVEVYDKKRKRDTKPMTLIAWRTVQGEKHGEEFRFAAKSVLQKEIDGEGNVTWAELDKAEGKKILEGVKPTERKKKQKN